MFAHRLNALAFRLKHRRDGAVAAEFALVLPFLMLMITGVFQLGVLMFSYNLMLQATRDTARQMSVCAITDSATASTWALSNLPSWVPVGAWTISSNPSGAGGSVSMTISADPAAITVFNLIHLPGPVTATTTMLKEPLAFSKVPC